MEGQVFTFDVGILNFGEKPMKVQSKDPKIGVGATGRLDAAEGQRFPAMIAPCRFPSPNTEKDRFDAGFLLLYT